MRDLPTLPRYAHLRDGQLVHDTLDDAPGWHHLAIGAVLGAVIGVILIIAGSL